MCSPEGGRVVLVTRPAATAGETLRRVAGLGFEAVAAPMQSIEVRPARLSAAGVQAVLVTSANAVPALGAALIGLPVFAVGDATASRVRAAGFARVESAAGDARALAALVRARCVPGGGALLLPTARGEGLALASALRAAGFTVRRRAVYAAVPQKALPAQARAALDAGTVAAAMFFSAAGARCFTKLLLAARAADCLKTVDALAISPAVAVPLAPLPWRRLRIAARPDQDAMLTLLADKTV
jgi:uroporphyrinogen-III synthase